MDWNEAKDKIQTNIQVDTCVNSDKSTYRKVKSVDKEQGFVIFIGKGKYSYVKIPWSILEECFRQLSSPSGFNRASFKKAFPCHCTQHPCYVHVIGQIFKNADIARYEKEGILTTFYLRRNS